MQLAEVNVFFKNIADFYTGTTYFDKYIRQMLENSIPQEKLFELEDQPILFHNLINFFIDFFS